MLGYFVIFYFASTNADLCYLHSCRLMLACVDLSGTVFTYVAFVPFRVAICVLEYLGSLIWYFNFFSDAKLFMTCNIFNYHCYIIELLLVVAAIKNSTSKIFSKECCCSEVFPKLLSLTKLCQTSWNLRFHQNLRQLLRNCNNRNSYFSDHTLTTLSGRLVQKWPNDKSLK